MHWGFMAGGSVWGPAQCPSAAVARPHWLLTCPGSVLSFACSRHGYVFMLFCDILNVKLLLMKIDLKPDSLPAPFTLLWAFTKNRTVLAPRETSLEDLPIFKQDFTTEMAESGILSLMERESSFICNLLKSSVTL